MNIDDSDNFIVNNYHINYYLVEPIIVIIMLLSIFCVSYRVPSPPYYCDSRPPLCLKCHENYIRVPILIKIGYG